MSFKKNISYYSYNSIDRAFAVKLPVLLKPGNFYMYKEKFLTNLFKKGKKDSGLSYYYNLMEDCKKISQVYGEFYLLSALAKTSPAMEMRKIRLSKRFSRTVPRVLGVRRRVSLGVKLFLNTFKVCKRSISLHYFVFQTLSEGNKAMESLHKANLELKMLLHAGIRFKKRIRYKDGLYYRFFKPSLKKYFWFHLGKVLDLRNNFRGFNKTTKLNRIVPRVYGYILREKRESLREEGRFENLKLRYNTKNMLYVKKKSLA